MAVSNVGKKPANEKFPASRTKEDDSGVKKAQRMLLTWICDEPKLYYQIKKYISADKFTEPIYMKVAGYLFEQIEKDAFKPEIILNFFDGEEEHREVAKILNTNILQEDATGKDRERAVNDAIKLILREYYDNKNRNATSLQELQDIVKRQSELANLHISLN